MKEEKQIRELIKLRKKEMGNYDKVGLVREANNTLKQIEDLKWVLGEYP